MKKSIFVFGALVSVLVLAVSIFASFPASAKADWVQQTGAGSRAWTAIASSSDGTKLVAVVGGSLGYSLGYIYTSTDSGATWTERTSAGLRHWRSVASSPDGTELVAGVCNYSSNYNNYIYTSENNGVTWTQQTGGLPGSGCWASVSSSLYIQGTNQFYVLNAVDENNGYTYTSVNGGFYSWEQRPNSGPRQWTSIAASSNADKLVAVPIDGYIYTAIGMGTQWVQRTGAGSHQWTSVASSSDGNKLVAVSNQNTHGYIYTSADSGVTWTQRTSAGQHQWWSVASSSDGTKLVAVDYGGYIYTSTDSGITWTQQTSAGSHTWQSITSSADGNKLAAVVNGGYIYTYSNSSYNIPTLTTQAATFISQTTATFNGTITDTGGQNASTRGFNYGTTTSYGTSTTENGSFGTGAFTKAITGLICNTTYHYRSYATNSTGTGFGNDQIFTTICQYSLTPTLTTQPATSIAQNTATLNGSITDTGGQNDTTRGFNYGTTINYGNTTTETGSFGAGAFTKSITGLTCATTYHYRSYAINSAGPGYTGYGNDQSFSTSACSSYNIPTLTTDAPSVIPPAVSSANSNTASITVILNGTITNTGGSNPTTRGFNYGATANYGTTTTEYGSFSTGGFTKSLTLSCGAVYHFRSYATNASGTGYGNDQTFSTGACSSGNQNQNQSQNQTGTKTPPATTTNPDSTPKTDTNIKSPFAPAGALDASDLSANALNGYQNASGNSNEIAFENTANSKPTLTLSKTLKLGMSGADVKALQMYLNNTGYVLATTGAGSPGNETSYFGKLTEQAVINFQRANKIDPVGIVGPITRKAM